MQYLIQHVTQKTDKIIYFCYRSKITGNCFQIHTQLERVKLKKKKKQKPLPRY